MRGATIYFLIILYPLTVKNSLHRSRKTHLKWKSRNQHKLTRVHQARDAESHTYYLPRMSNNDVAFYRNNSPSFEDVVLQLRKIGILDLPNVSVIRKVNSFQSRKAKRSVLSSSKPFKRCGIVLGGSNPCGTCQTTRTDYSIEGVAILRARNFDCARYSSCFNGRGTCQKLFRYFKLLAKHGDDWVRKTLEVPVACICVG